VQERPPPDPVVVARRSEGPVKATLGLSLGAEYGALRAWTGVLQGDIGARWNHVGVEALVTYVLPRTLPDRDGAGGVYQLIGGGLRGCGYTGPQGWAFFGCATVEGGGLRVATRGITPEDVLVGPFFGLGGGLGATWQRKRLGFHLRGDAVARVLGTFTSIAGQRSVTQFPVSFRLVAGVSLRVP